MRYAILWIDGEQAQANRWAELHKFPIGVISSQAQDLEAWHVDPLAGDTTVFVVMKKIAGLASGLTEGNGITGLEDRVIDIAKKRQTDKNPNIKKWAFMVARSKQATPPPVVVAAPVDPAKSKPPVTTVSVAKAPPSASSLQTLDAITIIEARFGAHNGWVDLTERVRAQVKNGRLQLVTFASILKDVKDPAFGEKKSLVVVYRYLGKVHVAIAPSGPNEGLTLPEVAKPKPAKTLPGVANTPAPSKPTPRPRATGPLQLLVAGYGSDNIIRFDVATGQSTVIAKLATGSGPWSIAVSPAGEIFVGLRGKKKNIVRLVPGPTGNPQGPLVAVDFTGTIGRFGPGLMAFDRRGLLNVAADTNRSVQRYDVKTGKLIESMRLRAANVVGLTLAGDSVYVAEYFQKTILKFDLTADPATGAKFIYKSNKLDRAHGMTIGHNGNLFVSNLQNSLVQEFNGKTGAFVKTFLDVKRLGGGSVKDLHFESRVGHYFLTSGDIVYELSADGALLAKHQSNALAGALGMAVAGPHSPPAVAAKEVKLKTLDGLIGYATIGNGHVPVAMRYQQGKVLQPASLVGSVTEAGKTPRDVKLTFRGHLQVPKRMLVKAYVAGGSSNGGHCWLRVAGESVGPLGDDHGKQAFRKMTLDAGDYPIEWTLTGGDFGCGLLKFTDGETEKLLPVVHTRSQMLDIPVDRVIQVSSDKPGWPVTTEWIDHTTKSWDTAASTALLVPQAKPLRLRVFTGFALTAATTYNKLVFDNLISTGKSFELKGENSLVVSGLVTEDTSGKLHFKGSVRTNAGLMQFDSAVKLSQGINASGVLASGGVFPCFVRFDRLKFSHSHAAEIERLRRLGARITEKDGKLTQIDLTNSLMTDKDMELLSGLNSLEHLSLNGCRNLTDDGLVYLRPLIQLRGLALERTNVTDAGMVHLKGLTNLGFLSLNWTNVGDSGLRNFSGMTKLGVLYLCSTKTADAGVAAMKHMKDLSWLDLRATQVTDAGMKHLSELPKLRLLCLYNDRITDAGIPPLTKLKHLASLTLNNTQVTDASLIMLARLPKLIDLDILGTKITKKAAHEFQARRPDCNVDVLNRPTITEFEIN